MKKLLRLVGMGLGVIGGLLILAVTGLYLNSARMLNQTYEFPNEKIIIPTDERSIANGRKWVEATCTGCHGANLSGTTMIDDPAIGRVDASNLTSGIGGIGSIYSDEDWVRALRHGVDREGKPLLIMPSSAFWNFSDGDLGEIIAYLKTIPPVDQERLVDLAFIGTMVLPTDASALHVKLIDHNSHPAEPVVGATTEYGRYLVNVSGCRDCHANDLSGKPGRTGRLAAPSITPGGSLQSWSAEDFINTMRTGVTPASRPLSPHDMPWREYSKYSDEELTAMYLYLKSLPTLPVASK